MTPELQRALMPKTTMARMVAIHIHNSVIWTTTINIMLATYAETLNLYWGGKDAAGRRPSNS